MRTEGHLMVKASEIFFSHLIDYLIKIRPAIDLFIDLS